MTTFRDSSSVVIESTKQYLAALNKTERDHYISLQAAQPAQIQLLKIDEVQVFSADEIGARLRALDQLADYTDLLYLLATSDAPDTSQARAKDLGDALNVLSDEVSRLANGKNERFKAASAGAFAIIGEVLHSIVANQLEAALKKAVLAGEQPINNLVLAVENDSRIAYQRKRQALSEARRIAADAYNGEFQKGAGADRDKLKGYADLISQAEDRWETFQVARPVDGLDEMRKANTAMVKFASIPKPTVSDLSSFVDAMEEFASTAKRVGEASRKLLN